MNTYMKSDTEDEALPKIIGFFVALPILALLFMWYNHVWIQWHVAYWQWLCLAVPFAIMSKSPFIHWPFGVIFAGAFVGQVANWIGLLSLPFIKL